MNTDTPKNTGLRAGLVCCLALLLFGVPVGATAAAAVKLTPLWQAEQFTGIAAIERAIISRTNEERRTHRLSSLTLSAELQLAARAALP